MNDQKCHRHLSMVRGERALYKEAEERWGQTLQLAVLMEECGELIQAAGKRIRAAEAGQQLDAFHQQRFAEELADVTIMTRQAAIMVGEEMVAEYIRIKLGRLREILKTTEVQP